jgi:hypothetical protein
MPDKKTDNPPIILTFTIDPALKLNAHGERAMSVSVVARRGDVGQVSRFDMSNWNTDLPAEIDRLMRLLLGGNLAVPDFPDMVQTTTAAEQSEAPEEAPEEGEEPVQVEAVAEPDPEATVEESEEYDITLYPASADATSSQPGLF